MDQSQASLQLQQQQQHQMMMAAQHDALSQQQAQCPQRFVSVRSPHPPNTLTFHTSPAMSYPPGAGSSDRDGGGGTREKTPIQMVQNMISGLQAAGQNALAVAMQHDAMSPRRGRRKSTSSDGSGRSSARPSSRPTPDAQLMTQQHHAVYDAMGNLHYQPMVPQQNMSLNVQGQHHTGALMQNNMQAGPGMMLSQRQEVLGPRGQHPGLVHTQQQQVLVAQGQHSGVARDQQQMLFAQGQHPGLTRDQQQQQVIVAPGQHPGMMPEHQQQVLVSPGQHLGVTSDQQQPVLVAHGQQPGFTMATNAVMSPLPVAIVTSSLTNVVSQNVSTAAPGNVL